MLSKAARRDGLPSSWASIPFRTGLLTIGMPGSDHGVPAWAPTIAELLKDQGYTSGQFGKNHLGDRDRHLPTARGFDEFFGNLYHLNAEEEPETQYYPKDPEFRKKYGPRGVIHSYADGRIEDTGPFTREREDNSIVVQSTDNGVQQGSGPDAGISPFYGEKGTTWEGGFRVPLVVRSPGVIKPNTVYNEVISHEDWLPTFLHAAGPRTDLWVELCGDAHLGNFRWFHCPDRKPVFD